MQKFKASIITCLAFSDFEGFFMPTCFQTYIYTKFQLRYFIFMVTNVHQYFLSLQFSSMTNYKVIYFNGRGRAEIIRLTLTQAKQSFSDTRVQGEEWTKLKPCRFFKYNIVSQYLMMHSGLLYN